MDSGVPLAANLPTVGATTRSLWRARRLIWELARRELQERYSGQVFGMLWTLGHPLFLTGLYVFVFAVVFRVKLSNSVDMPLDYASYILAGLVPWMGFQESMNRAASAITGSAALVKQSNLLPELLPVRSVVSALVSQGIGLAFLVCYVGFTHGGLPWTYVLMPVLLLFQTLAMTGTSMILGSVSVFIRDTKDFVQLFCIAGLYLMPVVYLPSWVPDLFAPLLYANPFSYMTWAYQDALYFGRFAHPIAWLVFGVGSIFVYIVGVRLFVRLKPVFGNFL